MIRETPRDPQVDLVRRYARILRSAPAEALRSARRDTPAEAPAPGAPMVRRPPRRGTAPRTPA